MRGEDKKIINELLHNNGFKSLTLEDLGELNLRISKEAKLPKFDDWDWFIGLDITIHDTYSTKIYLNDFEIIETETREFRRKSFKARLTFQIQDHFGLDINDMNGKIFELSSWFCSWLILQRYKTYGFKPFINEANFCTWIE
ncbi:DUF3289 family protein [Vagococcus sp. WN89Y]|uniref:DUF3289 family protein n=1 Tax=Vagococcus sp. WN89Y TaxID=3457258 RepID=UPI003FCD20D2